MSLQDDINQLRKSKASEVVNSKELAATLKRVSLELNLGCKFGGCKDCLVRCFYTFFRYINNLNAMAGSKYLFTDKIHKLGYRFKTKVYNNDNSTEEERKVIFESNKSRTVLFEPSSIPSNYVIDGEKLIVIEDEKPKRKYNRKKKKVEEESTESES